MSDGEMKKRPVSVIYFSQDSGDMAKRLGTRIRDQGALTRLVWSHLFRGPEQLIPEARAVVIQTSAPNSKLIAKCYQKFTHECEIHFVDNEGNFVDGPSDNSDKPAASTPVSEVEVDPAAAIAALRAQPDPEPVLSDPVETSLDESGSGSISDQALPGEGDDTSAGDDERN